MIKTSWKPIELLACLVIEKIMGSMPTAASSFVFKFHLVGKKHGTKMMVYMKGVRNTIRFFHLLPKLRTYLYVPNKDGAARIFPNSDAVIGNQTHVSSVAPLLKDLNPGCFTGRGSTGTAADYGSLG